MNTSREEEKKAKAKAKSAEAPDLFGEVEPLSEEQISQMETDPNDQGNQIDELLSTLESKDVKKGTELTAEYLDFKEWKIGDKRRYVYLGSSYLTDGNGEQIRAARLVDKNRTSFICASKVVVESLHKIEAVPAPVEIQFNGMKEGNKGRYHDVKVFQL